MDDGNLAWKKDRPCAAADAGCARSATVGYDTCLPCRVGALLRAHPEQLGPFAAALLAHLPSVADGDARTLSELRALERQLREALDARGRARNAAARLLGAPTLVRPDGDDGVCTFGAPAKGEGA